MKTALELIKELQLLVKLKVNLTFRMWKFWRFKRQVFVLPLQRISSNCIGSKIIYLAKWYQQSRVWCVQYRFRKAAVAAASYSNYQAIVVLDKMPYFQGEAVKVKLFWGVMMKIRNQLHFQDQGNC
jgi:hypothetical protein